METLSLYATPVLIIVILVSGIIAKLPLYELFVEGAMEGLEMCVKILPYVLGMLVAIAIFRSSGALEAFSVILMPICQLFNIPTEVLPLALMRPLSGSGALAVGSDLIATYGPDSYIGRVAAVMLGSTETTFYTIAVYFGSAGIIRTRHTVPAALAADLTGFLASAFAVRLFFGA